MKLLVTGGGGFVMAHVAGHWLKTSKDAEVVILDASALNPVVDRFLGEGSKRTTYIQGDVTDAAAWEAVPADVTHLVHGAAVTPHSTRGKNGVWRHPERENPALVCKVNLMGTVEALEWARKNGRIQKFVNVSSGSVYASRIPFAANYPISEGEWLGPEALYDITKRTSEEICSRYRALFRLPINSVRFSTVFGPLDRTTPYRSVQCAPNKLAHAALQGSTIRIRSSKAMGDFISASDVATALVQLLHAADRDLCHEIYNIAAGYATSIGSLANLMKGIVGQFDIIEDPPGDADVEQAAELSTGRYGAYDISRARADLKWAPRPLETMLREYVNWLKSEREFVLV